VHTHTHTHTHTHRCTHTHTSQLLVFLVNSLASFPGHSQAIPTVALVHSQYALVESWETRHV